MATKLQPKEIFNYVLYGIAALAIYKVGGKFGLWKTGADIAADAAEKANYWDFTKIPPGARLITYNTGLKLSKLLDDSKHWYNDDEEAIYSVFRSLNAKSQVTSLAYWFKKFYNQDLYYWLKSVLSESELAKVILIIETKPNV
jgi:hypothetical protein